MTARLATLGLLVLTNVSGDQLGAIVTANQEDRSVHLEQRFGDGVEYSPGWLNSLSFDMSSRSNYEHLCSPVCRRIRGHCPDRPDR